MNDNEARSLLIEQGALMMAALLVHHEAERQMAKCAVALDWPEIASLSVDDQQHCFLESCALIDTDPNHPAFAGVRTTFQSRMTDHEQRLLDQLDNAPMN